MDTSIPYRVWILLVILLAYHVYALDMLLRRDPPKDCFMLFLYVMGASFVWPMVWLESLPVSALTSKFLGRGKSKGAAPHLDRNRDIEMLLEEIEAEAKARAIK